MYTGGSKAIVTRAQFLALAAGWLVVCGLQTSAGQERLAKEALTAATISPPNTARLASLVPDDVGLLVEVENLGENAQRFLRGSFYRRFEQFPPVAAWHQENSNRLDRIAEQVAKQLGMSSEELWSKLLGQQAALGVWPSITGVATDSRMLLMVEAGDDGVLDRVVQSFCQAQQRVGDIAEAKELTHAGQGYQSRILRRDGVDTHIYLAAVGKIGILTGNEEVIQRVLELFAKPSAPGSLAQLPAYQASQLRLRPQAGVRMFVNPRAWEPAIRLAFEAAGEDVGLIETTFLETWKIADYWASSAEIRADSFVVESFFSFDRQRLPEPLRRLEDGLTGKAHFLERVPPDAALAFAGRIDIGRLSRMFLDGGASGEQNLAQVRDLAKGLLLGLDLFDDVLVNLGPEVGMYLKSSKEAFPIEVVIGVESQPRPAGDKRPPVTRVLDVALRSAMQVLAGQRQAAADADSGTDKSDTTKNQTRVKSEPVPGGNLTFLDGIPGLPTGFVLTYAVVGNYFFGGTSPSAVRGAIEIDPASSLAISPRVRALLSPRITEPSQLLYVDCRVLRQLMKENPQLFVNLVRLTRGLDAETAERGLKQLGDLLELAETVVFAGKFDDAGLAFSFGLSLEEAAPPAE